jgi:hypothetical protein
MRPVAFVKEHPVAVVVNMGLGMFIGPWVLGTVSRFTGISISIPTFRGKASAE